MQLSCWDSFFRFLLEFIKSQYEDIHSVYKIPRKCEWGIGKDRIVDIIKLLVHPEVGILDNPRVRRLSYNRAHRCSIIRRHCPCELVFRALLEVKPRKWFDNEVHYALPPPLPSPPPPILLKGRSSSLLTPLAHVSATWSLFACIQGFALGISNRYPNGQQDFAFVSSQGVGLRYALRFPVFEFEIGERGVERQREENLREIAVAEIEERKRNGKKQVTISDAGISGIVRAVTRLTRQDIKGSRPVIYANIYILVKKT